MSDKGLIAFDALFRDEGIVAYRTLKRLAPEGTAVQCLMQEFYCVDRKCDCRRVVLRLFESRKPDEIAAVINYGWETPSYYRKWSNDPTATGTDMCGAELELMGEQGPLADDLLAGFEQVIAKDPSLTAHFRRHYKRVKALVSTPGWQPPAGEVSQMLEGTPEIQEQRRQIPG